MTDSPRIDCRQLDALATPYIDGELAASDRDAVETHLHRCPPCHSRVSAEKAVKHLLRAQKTALGAAIAPPALKSRCRRAAQTADERSRVAHDDSPPAGLWHRAAPFALAASLVLVVGGAFVYEATEHSTRVMAAELTADHVKCFAINSLVDPTTNVATIERQLTSQFGWEVKLPGSLERAGLELVGARPCLYGEGRVAHIMYRYHGDPVSLFMLPQATRPQQLVDVMGHEAAIWSDRGRTFVLVAREPSSEVARMAAFVRAGIQ